MAITISSKRLQIDRTNTVVVGTIAVGAFLTVFSVFASRALLSQRSYQARVISAKSKADNTLIADVKAGNSLVTSYKTFVNQNPNIIGGDPSGQTPNSGDNATIILDSLPSEYDFPALATSLEAILTSGNYKINSITGTDASLTQQNVATNPTPVAMPFEINVTADYASIQNLITLFQKSVRPFQIQNISLSGGSDALTLDLKAQTYYQPAKNLNITTEVVK